MPPVFPSGRMPPGPAYRCSRPRLHEEGPAAQRWEGYPRRGVPVRRPGRQSAGKHVTPGPQSPATGTGRSDTCVDRWRGGVQNFDLNGRSHAGHILQPQKTGMSWTAFPHTPINTKKSLQTISRLKTLSKHGGFLLSHLVWQYHRR